MYNYQDYKSEILWTQDGNELLDEVNNRIETLLKRRQRFTMNDVLRGVEGFKYKIMACVDRLCEIGDISDITQGNGISENREFIKQ